MNYEGFSTLHLHSSHYSAITSYIRDCWKYGRD